MIKNRHIYTLSIEDCPMKFDNCIGCPFYCGVTISIHEPCGAAVICGWSKEYQKKLEQSNLTFNK